MNTILAVDDRPEARHALVRSLTRAGYDGRETATGRDALRLALTLPDLIVLDTALQDIDGFEVCRRLKSDVVTGAIPLGQKTAVFHDDEYRRRGLEAGVDESLTEPIEPKALEDTVQRRLAPRGR
jgi:CheY-like chemotaxis protein